MLESVEYENAAGDASRVIKRYSNRKLYDTKSSKYVTLLQIADMVRAGEDVQIIDNRTKEDKTEVTLALIISEELKNSPGGIPLTTLRALIRHDSSPPPSGVHTGVHPEASAVFARGWDALVDFFLDEEAVVGDQTDGQRAAARARFEQWRADLDARVRALPNTDAVTELQGQVKRLNERLAELERRFSSDSD